MADDAAAPIALRVYTAQERDALREVAETKWLFGRYRAGFNQTSRRYQVEEKRRAVDAQVRVYMLAGLLAADLLASEPRPAPFTWQDEMMLQLRR